MMLFCFHREILVHEIEKRIACRVQLKKKVMRSILRPEDPGSYTGDCSGNEIE